MLKFDGSLVAGVFTLGTVVKTYILWSYGSNHHLVCRKTGKTQYFDWAIFNSIISYVELAEGSILLVDPAMKNPKSTLWLCQQFAIEHGHRYSVGFPSENGDFP